MAWIKKIIDTDPAGIEYNYHIITKIILPAWDKNSSQTGWGQGAIVVNSYISKESRIAGKSSYMTYRIMIDFPLFATIDWNGQDNLLSWAYTVLKPYTQFSDAEDDLIPPVDEVGIV